MNSLDYIDSIFKITSNYYQNKDEVSAIDVQSTLLSIHDKIKRELDNRFYKVCMDILKHNPQIGNRHCCGCYMFPFDKIEIKFK